MLPGNGVDRVHLGGLAEYVYWKNCLWSPTSPDVGTPMSGDIGVRTPPRQILLNIPRRVSHQLGIDIPRARIDIHEHRDCILEQQHIRRSHERKWRGDDQVPRPDPRRAHAQVQTGRARVDADGMSAPGPLAKFSLEIQDALAHAQVGRVEYVNDSLTVRISEVRGRHGNFIHRYCVKSGENQAAMLLPEREEFAGIS
jgi:hypothetical protein